MQRSVLTSGMFEAVTLLSAHCAFAFLGDELLHYKRMLPLNTYPYAVKSCVNNEYIYKSFTIAEISLPSTMFIQIRLLLLDLWCYYLNDN